MANKIRLQKALLNAAFIVLGIVLASLGIKGFLIPNHFIDGGITGISMLLSNIFNIDLAILIFIINIPFVILGFVFINKKFGLLSGAAILGFVLVLLLLHFPVITKDKLLASVFGGFFLGAGIGLAIRGGGVLDGTEIMALLLSRKMRVKVGDAILALNVLIFCFGALVLGIEKALYSIVSYMAATKTIDFLLYGIEEYNGITIISSQSQQIREEIISETGRGVTIYRGKGGYSGEEQDILFCVVTRLEVPKITSIVEEADSEAFVVFHNLNDASGGMLRSKILH